MLARLAILLCIATSALPVGQAEELIVTVEKSPAGARVTVDGKLFAEYHTLCGQRPAVWPIIGPTGVGMTRDYPMLPAAEQGTDDHPHHRSLWFGHEGVGGTNTWTEPAKGKPLAGHFGRQVHREFTQLDSEANEAVVASINDWQDASGSKVCEDTRTLRFRAEENLRWIDFSIRIRATERDIDFADTKEGTFALRVADSMRVDAGNGGHIVNSRGDEDAAAWGMPAEWVDYSGPIDNENVGIAIMCHPSSFRPVPRWHVRTYGLFAANPFGERDFPPSSATKQGEYRLPRGEELHLRYRVVLHKGSHTEAGISDLFKQFASEK